MDRATISELQVWDPAARCFLILQSGMVLRTCRIRSSLAVGPQDRPAAYAAEFQLDGRTYRCPLYGFLPRTRVIDPKLRAAAVVLASTGFTASLVRGLITGIMLLNRSKVPTKVVGSPEEAVAWLAPQLPHHEGRPVTAAELWADVWRCAGILRVHPGEYSHRELADMVRARREEDWSHTAALLCQLDNFQPFRGARPAASPDDYNPFARRAPAAPAAPLSPRQSLNCFASAVFGVRFNG